MNERNTKINVTYRCPKHGEATWTVLADDPTDEDIQREADWVVKRSTADCRAKGMHELVGVVVEGPPPPPNQRFRVSFELAHEQAEWLKETASLMKVSVDTEVQLTLEWYIEGCLKRMREQKNK